VTTPGTLWRQIHELVNIIDRHTVEGQTVDRLATELHGLPMAKRQNVQRDLHLLARWLHVLTQKHLGERAVLRTLFGATKQLPELLSGAGQPENREANELARSLSALDNDGAPVPEDSHD
jgi:hypothetical protein